MLGLYFYAVRFFGIKSITHKYLIKGHTQNEGDSAYSLIERQVKRQLRGGPIYTTEGFFASVRAAKKQGEPFHVHELCHEDFYDVKHIASVIGPVNLTSVKLTDVKVINITSAHPYSVFFKTPYSNDFKEETAIKKRRMVGSVPLKPAFLAKPGLPRRKKEDLQEILTKKFIPKAYTHFYMSL